MAILMVLKMTRMEMVRKTTERMMPPFLAMLAQELMVSISYGNVVKINHGFGYMTVYGHCSKLLVKEGDKVKRGDIIALVGSTGLSTAPHCHYEVRVNGVPQNPLNFYKDGLSETEYQMAIESSYNFDENFED